jgi:hypothetical protein
VHKATVYRWLQEPEFQAAYREARREALRLPPPACSRFSGEAVEALRESSATARSRGRPGWGGRACDPRLRREDDRARGLRGQARPAGGAVVKRRGPPPPGEAGDPHPRAVPGRLPAGRTPRGPGPRRGAHRRGGRPPGRRQPGRGRRDPAPLPGLPAREGGAKERASCSQPPTGRPRTGARTRGAARTSGSSPTKSRRGVSTPRAYSTSCTSMVREGAGHGGHRYLQPRPHAKLEKIRRALAGRREYLRPEIGPCVQRRTLVGIGRCDEDREHGLGVGPLRAVLGS